MSEMLRIDDGSLGDNPVLAEVLPAAEADALRRLSSPDIDEELIEEIRLAFGLNGKEIVLTSSATEALMTIIATFRGEAPVAVSSPTYGRLFLTLREQGLPFEAWESIPALTTIAEQSRAKLLYLTSTYRPIDGRSLKKHERSEIADIATTTGALVIDDSPYDQLYYEQRPKNFGTEFARTLQVGTFSKILKPGIAGFIAGRRDEIDPLREALPKPTTEDRIKRAVALCALKQKYLEDLRTSFLSRWDMFRNTLLEYGITGFNDIEGGMFTSLTLPPELDRGALREHCQAQNLQIGSSAKLFPDGLERPLLRMNVLRNSPENVRKIIDILSTALTSSYREILSKKKAHAINGDSHEPSHTM